MNTEKRNFDKDAALWDENPVRLKMTQDIANTIITHIPLSSALDVLDFGCGTGLVTFQLQPLVRSITGVDSSQGMLEMYKAKIDKLKLSNVKAALIDLDKGDKLSGEYDVIVSSMTLHHIPNIEELFKQFHAILKPGGWLGIADLDQDSGLFHKDNTGVFHYGFNRAQLRQSLMDAGFVHVSAVDAAKTERTGKDGITRQFSIFLMSGQKDSAGY
ncbi:MAG TPA: class I SAM-dependent methyltransferase [bacterium]|nr:class I SAM-dependent methyltransferase [bacterium]HPN42051.1 class I SAM-dependent methyltransferase [bacterium]